MNQKLKSLAYLLHKYRTNEKLISQIHAQSLSLGFCYTHQPFASQLFNAYTKLGKPLEARRLFDQIPSPDLVSWTCLVYLYLRLGLPEKAFSVFSALVLSSGLRPDDFSAVAALSACGRNNDLVNGKLVHGMIFRFELGFCQPIVGNALIDMYCRNGRIRLGQSVFDTMVIKDIASWTSLLNGYVICNDIGAARQVFDEMPLRNTISWTAMIVGHVRGKDPIRGLELFRHMRVESEDHPTAVTIVAVLSACADIGARDFGQSVHVHVEKLPGLAADVTVENGLIEMYSKSGSIDVAVKIFNRIIDRDIFTWTAMISGMALHGRGRNALELLDKMLECGQIPNEVTFISVLSACSHAGLVSEGQNLFDKMNHICGLEPKIEHYGCMVDILGRAGCLKQALELIERMPMNPDAVIWRSLLSACLEHKDLKFAEMVGKKVLELEPDDDGVHILLWNIYSFASNWKDALKIREVMRGQKIKKKPGCSWIEVNGVVIEFLAEVMHNVSMDIHLVIESIMNQSKLDVDMPVLE